MTARASMLWEPLPTEDSSDDTTALSQLTSTYTKTIADKHMMRQSTAYRMKSSPYYGPCMHVLFCASGVAVVVLTQWEDYAGLGGREDDLVTRTNGLTVLPAFLGMSFATVFLFRPHDGHRLFDIKMLPIALFGLLGEIANQVSITLAGSLTFTVVYASLTIWSALIGIPVLRKTPNKYQWASLCLIVLGLFASAASHTAAGTDGSAGISNTTNGTRPTEVPKGHAAQYMIGAASGLLGSLSYAAMYVGVELISKPGDAPPMTALCSFCGLSSSCVLSLYILLWDGPRWAELVEGSINESYSSVMGMYLLLIALGFVHMQSFFYVSRLSAVLAGVNKATQAVFVFIASHVFYCDRDPQQCLTIPKGISMVLVLLGVLVFSFSKKCSPQIARERQLTVTTEDGFIQLPGYRPTADYIEFRHSWHGVPASVLSQTSSADEVHTLKLPKSRTDGDLASVARQDVDASAWRELGGYTESEGIAREGHVQWETDTSGADTSGP